MQDQINPISQIVAEHRKARNESLRTFAEALVISHQTIANWEEATSEPDPRTLLELLKLDGWKQDFATDLLAAVFPDLFQPATEIGRRILNNGSNEK